MTGHLHRLTALTSFTRCSLGVLHTQVWHILSCVQVYRPLFLQSLSKNVHCGQEDTDKYLSVGNESALNTIKCQAAAHSLNLVGIKAWPTHTTIMVYSGMQLMIHK